MTITRTLPLVALGLVLTPHLLQAQAPPHYRDFQLGSSVLSIEALTKVTASETRTVHLRPALIQELAWRPPYFAGGSSAPSTDPVQQIVFGFYDNQLFELVINYDRRRTDGMTTVDLIDALSMTYGHPSTPGVKPRAGVPQSEEEYGTSLAQWGDAAYSVALYRSSYVPAFRVIVTSLPLKTLARAADAEARRLNALEAPQLESARRQKEAEATRAAQEKARLENKAAFRP